MSYVNSTVTAAMMLSTALMLIHPVPWTIILFYFVFGVYKDAEISIDAILGNNVANLSETVKANKSEYSFLSELFLLAGRISGYLMLTAYVVDENSMVLWLFLPAMTGIMTCFNRLLKRVPVA